MQNKLEAILTPKKWVFHFSLPLLLIFAVCIGILIKLGYWQLARAQEKALIIADATSRANHQPLTLNTLKPTLETMLYHPIIIKGQFQNDRTFLLDNQIHQGQVGYHVLTPLKVEDDNRWVLVDRGFIPRNIDRDNLPFIAPVNQPVSLRGVIHVPAKHLLLLGSDVENPNDWPRVIEGLRIDKLEKELDQSLYSFIVIADAKQSHLYEYDWTPVVMGPERHRAYAVQWFALASVLFILYGVVSIRREKKDENE